MTRGARTRSLTEGAMLTSLTVVLSLLGTYLLPYLLLIVPVPLTVLVYRHGLRTGILATLTAAMATGILIHPLNVLVMLLVVGTLGTALGIAFRENLKPTTTLLVGTLVTGFSMFLLFTLSFYVLQVNNLEMLFESVEESLNAAFSAYSKLGVDASRLPLTREAIAEAMKIMRRSVPALLAGSALLMSFVSFWLSRLVINRMAGEERVGWFPPFPRWTFPWYMAWGYILGSGLSIIRPLAAWQFLVTIGINLWVFFSFLFFVAGLSIVWFYFDKYSVKVWLRLVLLFSLSGLPIIFQMMTWAGVLDAFFDFRGVRSR